ncbi:hypothetical protein K458DRAFT_426537 [Lentithecium fluviatile CBS 122367]|uniref:Beta-lactamase-related domain-containing protein n=1 Tax=Lentithecium fluviatile CBS 122367 TaxID=1168545 RepID=A0A6G1JLZ3_9PLEO|nr:hypothetical protein K458DRAFT_426537 [Lentithecium fluviatile CBS 122367]
MACWIGTPQSATISQNFSVRMMTLGSRRHCAISQATGRVSRQQASGGARWRANFCFTTPNLALPHAVRNDGTASKISMNTSDSVLSPGIEKGIDTIPGSPFTQLCIILAPHIPITPGSSSSYCLGTYRTKLPGLLSCTSLNAPLLGKIVPTFGSKNIGAEVFHHTGNIPGYFGSYFLVPKTQSGVVCLTNATPLFDPSDFGAQIALGVLLSERKPDNLLALGKLATKTQIAWYQNVHTHLPSKRTTTPPSLYADTYTNRASNFILLVKPTATGIHIAVQGSSKTTYDVEPLDRDTFCWAADSNRDVCRGKFPNPFPGFRMVRFWVIESWVNRLILHTDVMSKPDVFRRVKEDQGKL